MSTIPVLVVQIERYANEMCRHHLFNAGFKEGDDFVILSNPLEAEALIGPGESQLLITGLMGSPEETHRAIERFRVKNPELVVAKMSASLLDETKFDVSIDKGSGASFCLEIVGLVCRYDSGGLHRVNR